MRAEMMIALVVGFGLARVKVRLQRCLRVNYDPLPARNADDKVWPQGAPVGVDRALLDEVAVREHPGDLDDAAQLHLAPAASRLWLPQCGHEVPGLAAQ